MSTRGVVCTEDAVRSTAEAVAVKNGKIVFVGSGADAQAFVGAGTTVVDLKGLLLLPYFIDSHAHADSALGDLYQVDLYNVHGNMKWYQKQIKAFAKAHPDVAIIQGGGWDASILPVIGPTRYQLDAVVKDRPVAVWDLSYHELWCNSAALKLGGITAKTPNPPGGIIERFPGTRIPSGTLRESAAALVTDKIPDWTVEQYEAGLLHLQKDILGPLGLTTVWRPASSHRHLIERHRRLRTLAQEGKLTARYRAGLHDPPSDSSTSRSRRSWPNAPRQVIYGRSGEAVHRRRGEGHTGC